MEDNATLVTREQYVAMLIDASFKDAAEIEEGFMRWCEQHAPIWREQGFSNVTELDALETTMLGPVKVTAALVY